MNDLPPKALLRPDEVARVFQIPCQKCGKGAFLIRGLCPECAPGLHRTHNEQMDAYSKAASAFEAETGKTPLAAWYEFEGWCGKAVLK